MKSSRLILAALTLAAGCSVSNRGDPTGPLREGAGTLDDTVTVTLGRSVLTRDGGARVTFLEKLADSRCGIDAICIWAGDVGVMLRVETLEQTAEGRTHTFLTPREFEVGDYQISLVDVYPYPGDRREIATSAKVRVLRPAVK